MQKTSRKIERKRKCVWFLNIQKSTGATIYLCDIKKITVFLKSIINNITIVLGFATVASFNSTQRHPHDERNTRRKKTGSVFVLILEHKILTNFTVIIVGITLLLLLIMRHIMGNTRYLHLKMRSYSLSNNQDWQCSICSYLIAINNRVINWIGTGLIDAFGMVVLGLSLII